MAWKFYGPDINGVYGGMQGVGGLEAVVNGPRQSTPIINDLRGNALGLYNLAQSSLNLFPSRVTGYGSVPGYAPLPLADGAKVAQSSAWRDKWPDITGFYYLGNRYYDPSPETGFPLTRHPMRVIPMDTVFAEATLSIIMMRTGGERIRSWARIRLQPRPNDPLGLFSQPMLAAGMPGVNLTQIYNPNDPSGLFSSQSILTGGAIGTAGVLEQAGQSAG